MIQEDSSCYRCFNAVAAVNSEFSAWNPDFAEKLFALVPLGVDTPDTYPGSIRETSQLIRVVPTGSTRSPDLHAIT